MNPVMGRTLFSLVTTLLVLSLIMLPLLDPHSPEFVIDALSLILCSIMLVAVIWDIRKQAKAGY